jgi:lysozyme
MALFTEHDQKGLIVQLHRDEGKKADKNGNHVAYLDTKGILTIGYGHNCQASPVPGVSKPGDTITDAQANLIFERDLAAHVREVRRKLPWVDSLDAPRQAVLYNMAFNLGIAGLLGFKNTLAFVRVGDFKNAAANMLKSKWREDVKARAIRLAEQMRTGVWQ